MVPFQAALRSVFDRQDRHDIRETLTKGAAMEEARVDRRTFVMGAAAIGAAALTGGMLGGCAGGEGAEPAVGSAPVEPSPMLEPAPASSSEPLPYDSVFPPHEPCGRGVGAR
ncbi:DUF362 domain-containing protein, partial [Eggerthella lenta]|nr:DUF362 domain-containing protein [Eggerthella lenta]